MPTPRKKSIFRDEDDDKIANEIMEEEYSKMKNNFEL